MNSAFLIALLIVQLKNPTGDPTANFAAAKSLIDAATQYLAPTDAEIPSGVKVL